MIAWTAPTSSMLLSFVLSCFTMKCVFWLLGVLKQREGENPSWIIKSENRSIFHAVVCENASCHGPSVPHAGKHRAINATYLRWRYLLPHPASRPQRGTSNSLSAILKDAVLDNAGVEIITQAGDKCRLCSEFGQCLLGLRTA